MIKLNSETSKHVFNDLENIHIYIKMKYINSKESMFCLCCIIQCGIKWLIIHAKTLKGGLGKVIFLITFPLQ